MNTTGWTREETAERRRAWNAAVAGGAVTGANGKANMGKVAALQSRLGFTHQQLADAVRAHDLDGTRAAHEARLDVQRERLADAVADARERAERTFERLHAAEDALAWHRKAELERDVETARVALCAFDAEHPEVIGAIEAERAAENARTLARNEWM